MKFFNLIKNLKTLKLEFITDGEKKNKLLQLFLFLKQRIFQIKQ